MRYNSLIRIVSILILFIIFDSSSSQNVSYSLDQEEQLLDLKPLAYDNYNDRRLLWGTYKPHLISAITQKIPNPITIGILYTPYMAWKLSTNDFLSQLRHKVTGLIRNYYQYHNGIDFSWQVIIDHGLNLNINTTYIKENLDKMPYHEWKYLIEVGRLRNDTLESNEMNMVEERKSSGSDGDSGNSNDNVGESKTINDDNHDAKGKDEDNQGMGTEQVDKERVEDRETGQKQIEEKQGDSEVEKKDDSDTLRSAVNDADGDLQAKSSVAEALEPKELPMDDSQKQMESSEIMGGNGADAGEVDDKKITEENSSARNDDNTGLDSDNLEKPQQLEKDQDQDSVLTEEDYIPSNPIPAKDLDLRQILGRYTQYVYITLEEFESSQPDNSYIDKIERSSKSSITMRILNKEDKILKGYVRVDIIDQDSVVDDVDICASIEQKSYNWMVGMNIYRGLFMDNQRRGVQFNQMKCGLNDTKKTNAVFVKIIGKAGYKVLVYFDSVKVPEKIMLERFYEMRNDHVLKFNEKLNEIFPIKNVNMTSITTEYNDLKGLSEHSLSNLLGGISYSYGKIRVRSTYESNEALIQHNKELFTGTPCRSGFPRGFLWDEGFHQLAICRWDIELCINMLKTWFNSMDNRGWIPREQARGLELEDSFKQKNFLYQDREEANPPTLILAINYLKNLLIAADSRLEDNVKDPKLVKLMKDMPNIDDKLADKIYQFLRQIRPLLHKWYNFYKNTQLNTNELLVGELLGRIFRWKCKEPCDSNFYMGSGLDDYPRHEFSEISIGHLDLQSWMAFLVKSIIDLDDYFGEDSEDLYEEYELIKLGFQEFYDPRRNLFKDIIANREHLRTGVHKLYSTHLGYVNIFPLFLGIVNPKKGQQVFTSIMGLLSHSSLLFSNHGIRSLATIDTYYEKGHKYWTEPIWLNINYLVLSGLYQYYWDSYNVDQYHESVRHSLINMVSHNYKYTQTVWENYNSKNGVGQGFPVFTGWSGACALLILGNKY